MATLRGLGQWAKGELGFAARKLANTERSTQRGRIAGNAGLWDELADRLGAPALPRETREDEVHVEQLIPTRFRNR
ncbi:MAG TPA: hypothetical protein VEW42_03050 [Candidatus Eisenbacteria bacterium]|nr:hypothetical protein [Candidatus Eisenbacteria bacterium]